ncbi:MAG TPA: hypothetical protein VMR98_04230 [Candidatus Polarisedimenticolaceae bacterium]|nr:hypothetical protein [Candidatus Polarisedimenticolaceae bacterium]
MNRKTIIWVGAIGGSFIGGLIPQMLGADWMSLWGLLTSMVGGLLGIWAAFKLTQG